MPPFGRAQHVPGIRFVSEGPDAKQSFVTELFCRRYQEPAELDLRHPFSQDVPCFLVYSVCDVSCFPHEVDFKGRFDLLISLIIPEPSTTLEFGNVDWRRRYLSGRENVHLDGRRGHFSACSATREGSSRGFSADHVLEGRFRPGSFQLPLDHEEGSRPREQKEGHPGPFLRDRSGPFSGEREKRPPLPVHPLSELLWRSSISFAGV